MSLLGSVNRHLIALSFILAEALTWITPPSLVTVTPLVSSLPLQMKIIWGEGHKTTPWSSLLILVLSQELVWGFFRYCVLIQTRQKIYIYCLGKKSHSFFMERCGFGVNEWCRCEKMSILSKGWSQVKYHWHSCAPRDFSTVLSCYMKKMFVLWSATPFRDVLQQLWGVRGVMTLLLF